MAFAGRHLCFSLPQTRSSGGPRPAPTSGGGTALRVLPPQHSPAAGSTLRCGLQPPEAVSLRRGGAVCACAAAAAWLVPARWGPGRVAMAAGGGGRRWRMVAPLLLVVFQLAGAASAAALPVVINTWAFRKAAETGAPAGGRAGAGGAGQGRAVPFCADRSVLPRCSLLQLRSRRGARGFGVTTK